MRGFVDRSGGRLVLVTSRQGLARYRDERRRRCGARGRCGLTAALLGVEGLHALELTEASAGLGRIVALYHRPSTSYHNYVLLV